MYEIYFCDNFSFVQVAFYMVGNIDEVAAKAERLAAERGD